MALFPFSFSPLFRFAAVQKALLRERMEREERETRRRQREAQQVEGGARGGRGDKEGGLQVCVEGGGDGGGR